MLFLGTEKYPKEGDFEAFLSTNGGSSNAYTDSENTVYYFKMDGDSNSKVEEALSRFGSFFTSPLFTESATNRELNAIESENSKNLQNDVFRLFQIEKSRVSSRHPMSKFFTGNKMTLLENTKAKGIDLREELLKFYNKYYSANQMTLAICGPQSIDELERYVTDSGFGLVPNNEREKPEQMWAGIVPPYGKDGAGSVIPSFQHMVQVVPVQDLRQVSLSWPVIFNSADDSNLHKKKRLQKPDSFLGHLLGHEGPGSLLSYLKSQGWANGVGSGTSEELSDVLILEITVELTSKGFKNIDKVCEAVFSYVEMMKQEQIPNHVLDEVLQLSELDWRFATKGDVGGYATGLANAMQHYPPELYIAGPRRVALQDSRRQLYEKSKPRTSFASNGDRNTCRTAIEEFLSYLTVDNVMATTLSKSFAGQTKKKEKWYGTDYSAVKIPSVTLASWTNPSLAKDLGMFYPRPNVFIPTEKGLALKKGVKREPPRKKTLEGRMEPLAPPSVIRDDGAAGKWTVHYRKDDRFGLPKVYAIFEVLNNRVYSSAETVALGVLYQLCIDDYLTEYAYDATMAGLSYNIQLLPRGVRLTFGGYNDKLQDFAVYVTQQIVQQVSKFLPQSQEEFDRFKDRASRGLAAFDVKQPYSHAIYYSSLLLQPLKFNFPNNEVRQALEASSLEELQRYSKIIWVSGKGEALVQGNIDENEALQLVSKLDAVLAFDPLTSPDQIPPRVKALPLDKASTKLLLEEPNKSNNNAASQVTIQCLSKSDKDHVLMELVSVVLSEKYFEDLRTRQQLGYIVSSGLKALEETRMLSFIVQSSVAPADKLTQATLKFIEGARDKHLQPLTEDEVSVYIKGLLDNKLEPDKLLATETSRNWNEISSGRYQFDRIPREARVLLEIRKEDLLTFWDSYFLPANRRMLISEDVPLDGVASSKPLPKPSYGYASSGTGAAAASSTSKDSKIPQQHKELVLGLDDIAQYRKDREREQASGAFSSFQ
jgi:insulysin